MLRILVDRPHVRRFATYRRSMLALLLCLTGHIVHAAGMQGDKRLLEAAAAKYRENCDRLKAWKGTANYSYHTRDSANEGKGESFPIYFAYDLSNRREWYQYEQVRNAVNNSTGQRKPGLMLISELLVDGTYYHLHVFQSSSRRRAYASAKRHMRPSWFPRALLS